MCLPGGGVGGGGEGRWEGERRWWEKSLKPSEEELLPTPVARRDAEKPGEGAGEAEVVEPWLAALGKTEHAAVSAVWAGWEGGSEKRSQANWWLKKHRHCCLGSRLALPFSSCGTLNKVTSAIL